jgi:hypothetical protein
MLTLDVLTPASILVQMLSEIPLDHAAGSNTDVTARSLQPQTYDAPPLPVETFEGTRAAFTQTRNWRHEQTSYHSQTPRRL